MSDNKETSTPQSPGGWPEPLGSPLWSPTHHDNAISILYPNDGLFVDRSFPMGKVQLQHVVQWKRPKVSSHK